MVGKRFPKCHHNFQLRTHGYGWHQIKAKFPMSLAPVLKGYPLPSQRNIDI